MAAPLAAAAKAFPPPPPSTPIIKVQKRGRNLLPPPLSMCGAENEGKRRKKREVEKEKGFMELIHKFKAFHTKFITVIFLLFQLQHFRIERK